MSQNKQVLMVCVALWHHSTSTGSKHNAAVLTDSQAFSHQRACYSSFAYTSVNAGKSISHTRDILSSHDCHTNQNKQNSSPKLWVKIYRKHCSKKYPFSFKVKYTEIKIISRAFDSLFIVCARIVYTGRWQRCKRNLCSTPSGERKILKTFLRLC